MICDCQKGVSLIITFLIMTIMLAMVLNISTILFNKIKIIGDIGNSAVALHVANTGIEATLYYDKKKIPDGGNRGFCNTCNVCNDSVLDPNIRCNNCALSGSDCGLITCTSCQLNYNSTFAGKTYTIFATVSPNIVDPLLSDFIINSKGSYKDTARQVDYKIIGN